LIIFKKSAIIKLQKSRERQRWSHWKWEICIRGNTASTSTTNKNLGNSSWQTTKYLL